MLGVLGFLGTLFSLMRRCIFCRGAANSKEHLWPKWVLEKIKPTEIEGFIGYNTNLSFNAEWKVRTVCKSCNQGWMSNLEGTSCGILGPLIDDTSTFLNITQRWSVAVWSVKTAMILDSALSSALPLFYTQEERDKLMESSTIAPRTFIWLGRFLGSRDIGASTTEIKTGEPGMNIFPARVSTFLLNCLVIQVMTIHPTAEYGDRTILIRPAEGPWEHLTIGCWPTRGMNVYWPPVLAMNFGRGILDFRNFADRFNLGKDVPLPPRE